MDERPISVLFVCHGNICRSPMAEFIFKALVKARGLDDRYRVASAAVSAEEIGNPIYPPAKRCLSQHGVAFDPDKRARQVSREDYDRLMSYTGTGRDVADPWYTGDFEVTFQDILEGCEAMLR